jgi:hypothetical protein
LGGNKLVKFKNNNMSYIVRFLFSGLIYFAVRAFVKDKKKFNIYFFSIYGALVVVELIIGSYFS